MTLIAVATTYGSVEIGDNFYISGCIVKNQMKIRENAIIGMGSIVLKNVEDSTDVVGNPEKKMKLGFVVIIFENQNEYLKQFQPLLFRRV